jgi:LPXTG-site transpeptidase (sortase) family protein
VTSLSRRAFATAAAASLLTGCGGGNSGKSGTKGTNSGHGRRANHTPVTQLPPNTPPSAHPAAKAARPPARSVPVGLRIPAIGVDTPVMQLGLAADGSVQVPPVTAHDRAGWYRNSPTPGRTGPSVILGHVTVGAYGDGVFRHLARLRPGDRIVTRLKNGGAPEFTVTDVRTVAKSDFPTEAVYGDVDRPELRLITCGGPRAGTGYLDNVIVFARLASAGS